MITIYIGALIIINRDSLNASIKICAKLIVFNEITPLYLADRLER